MELIDTVVYDQALPLTFKAPIFTTKDSAIIHMNGGGINKAIICAQHISILHCVRVNEHARILGSPTFSCILGYGTHNLP